VGLHSLNPLSLASEGSEIIALACPGDGATIGEKKLDLPLYVGGRVWKKNGGCCRIREKKPPPASKHSEKRKITFVQRT